jgi:hypothetical protein
MGVDPCSLRSNSIFISASISISPERELPESLSIGLLPRSTSIAQQCMLSTLKVDVSSVNGMHFICIEVHDTRREGWKYFRRVCWRGSNGSGNDGGELRVVDSSDEDKEYDTDFFWAENSKRIVFSGTVRRIWIMHESPAKRIADGPISP